MKRRILLTVAILMIMSLAACNFLSDDPTEENEEEIGTGEETEQETNDEEENDDEQEIDEPGEEEGAEEDDADDGDNDGDEAEEEEETATAPNLTAFYGTWEMEDEEGASDTMILEIGEADAGDVIDQEEDFEYIRFGYKYSEFFPIEKIVEIEKLESENVYSIVTSYVEEEGEDTGSMIEEGAGQETHYTIELVEDNRLLLTYMSEEEVNEMWFTKE